MPTVPFPVTNYPTPLLERLLSLTLATLQQGEYAQDIDGVLFLRTDETAPDGVGLVSSTGRTYRLGDLDTSSPVRRIAGFPSVLDPLETPVVYLDPPPDVLQRELDARQPRHVRVGAGLALNNTQYGGQYVRVGDEPIAFTAQILGPVPLSMLVSPGTGRLWVVHLVSGGLLSVPASVCRLIPPPSDRTSV